MELKVAQAGLVKSQIIQLNVCVLQERKILFVTLTFLTKTSALSIVVL